MKNKTTNTPAPKEKQNKLTKKSNSLEYNSVVMCLSVSSDIYEQIQKVCFGVLTNIAAQLLYCGFPFWFSCIFRPDKHNLTYSLFDISTLTQL